MVSCGIIQSIMSSQRYNPDQDYEASPWRIIDDEAPVERPTFGPKKENDSKPKPPQSDKAVLRSAFQRERKERYGSELGSGPRDLKGRTREQLDQQAEGVREAREKAFGHTPVADQLVMDFDSKPETSEEVISETMPKPFDDSRDTLREVRASKVVPLSPPRPVDPSKLPSAH